MRPHHVTLRVIVALAFGWATAAHALTSEQRLLLLGGQGKSNVAAGTPQAIAIQANGWQGVTTFAGLKTGGAYSLTPNATAKLDVTLTSPGYPQDCNGTASAPTIGTITRHVYGTRSMLQAYPAQASPTELGNSGNAKVTIPLSNYIYSTDTIAQIAYTAGLYGASLTQTLTSGITNNSTASYPKPVVTWDVPPKQILGAGTEIGVSAFHTFSMNSQPVACVLITGTPITGSPVTKIAYYGKSSLFSDNLPDYKVTFADSDFGSNGNAAVTFTFAAYPWVGDSGAVYTSTSTFPTNTDVGALVMQTGGATASYVYVNNSTGVDSTCISSTTAGTAAALPCLTITKAYTVSFAAHSDCSNCFIRLTNTGTSYTWDTTAPTGATRTALNSWFWIEGDPADSDPYNNITIQTSGSGNAKNLNTGSSNSFFGVRNVGLHLPASTGSFMWLATHGMQWMNRVKFTSSDTSGAAWNTQTPYTFVTGGSFTGTTAAVCVLCLSSVNLVPQLIRGVATNQAMQAPVIESTTVDASLITGKFATMGNTANERPTNVIFYNNVITGWAGSGNGINLTDVGSSPAAVNNIAIVQNEVVASNTGGVTFSLGDHDVLNPQFNNLVIDYNTFVPTQATFNNPNMPARVNFHSVPAVGQLPSTGSSAQSTYTNVQWRRSITGFWVTKGDWFSGANDGNTGAYYVTGGWPSRYAVGYSYTVAMTTTALPAFDPYFEGFGSVRSPYATTTPNAAAVTFNNWSTLDLRPLTNFPTLPSGISNQGLKWDLNGVLRKTDGTGAPGAFEHP